MKKNKKIFLVRHAETYANIGNFDGQSYPQHIRITDNGHEQARGLLKKIKKPNKFFVSKYFRTLETAWYLMEKHKNIPVTVHHDLHEFTYISTKKILESTKDGNKDFSIIKEYWDRLDPHYKDGENSESFSEFITRVKNVYDFLKKDKNTGNIYLFTHGNFSRGFLIIHNEFPKLFKQKKIDKKNLKSLMQRYSDAYSKKEYQLKNCDIVDITGIILG